MNESFVSKDTRYFHSRQLAAERELSSQLRSQLFYLWTFVAQQDLWEDALDFLDEHCDPHTPIDFLPSEVPF